jgi:hypothetical protein
MSTHSCCRVYYHTSVILYLNKFCTLLLLYLTIEIKDKGSVKDIIEKKIKKKNKWYNLFLVFWAGQICKISCLGYRRKGYIDRFSLLSVYTRREPRNERSLCRAPMRGCSFFQGGTAFKDWVCGKLGSISGTVLGSASRASKKLVSGGKKTNSYVATCSPYRDRIDRP